MLRQITGHLRGWLAGFGAYHNVHYKLSMLSREELADIGISHSDIDRIAQQYKREVRNEYLKGT